MLKNHIALLLNSLEERIECNIREIWVSYGGNSEECRLPKYDAVKSGKTLRGFGSTLWLHISFYPEVAARSSYRNVGKFLPDYVLSLFGRQVFLSTSPWIPASGNFTHCQVCLGGRRPGFGRAAVPDIPPPFRHQFEVRVVPRHHPVS